MPGSHHRRGRDHAVLIPQRCGRDLDGGCRSLAVPGEGLDRVQTGTPTQQLVDDAGLVVERHHLGQRREAVAPGGEPAAGAADEIVDREAEREIDVEPVEARRGVERELTVAERRAIGLDQHGARARRERRARALELLAGAGVADQAGKLPSALSGGELQRVAVARALANDPPIVVADEPTGNLDSHTAASVLALFDDLVARGRTLLVVTHDEQIAERADRVVRLADGAVAAQEVRA